MRSHQYGCSSLIINFQKRFKTLLEETLEALSFQLHRPRQLLDCKAILDAPATIWFVVILTGLKIRNSL